jgi:hypothetical protein
MLMLGLTRVAISKASFALLKTSTKAPVFLMNMFLIKSVLP